MLGKRFGGAAAPGCAYPGVVRRDAGEVSRTSLTAIAGFERTHGRAAMAYMPSWISQIRWETLAGRANPAWRASLSIRRRVYCRKASATWVARRRHPGIRPRSFASLTAEVRFCHAAGNVLSERDDLIGRVVTGAGERLLDLLLTVLRFGVEISGHQVGLAREIAVQQILAATSRVDDLAHADGANTPRIEQLRGRLENAFPRARSGSASHDGLPGRVEPTDRSAQYGPWPAARAIPDRTVPDRAVPIPCGLVPASSCHATDFAYWRGAAGPSPLAPTGQPSAALPVPLRCGPVHGPHRAGWRRSPGSSRCRGRSRSVRGRRQAGW